MIEPLSLQLEKLNTQSPFLNFLCRETQHEVSKDIFISKTVDPFLMRKKSYTA